MYLIFREDARRFEAHDAKNEYSYLRGNGFGWDPDRNCWWTGDVLRAEQFIHTADQATQQKIFELKARSQHQILASRALAPTVGFQVPAPAGLQYMTFQLAGIEYLVQRPKALCADDVGLGKTMQGIGRINYLNLVEGIADPNVLIICPAKIMYQWQQQLQKWLVNPLSVAVSRQRIWPDTQIKIMNFESLWWFEPEIRAINWDLMIVDEAHFLMNPKAERTRFVFGWKDPDGVEPDIDPIPCQRAVFLTATPIRNRPMEAFPLLHYLDPVAWPSATQFAKEFCQGGMVLIKKGKHAGTMRLKAGGAANLYELQARMRETVMIRRLTKDANHELYTKCPKRRRVVTLPCAEAGVLSALQEELDAWKDHEAQLKKLRLAVDAAKSAGNDAELRQALSAMRKQVSISFNQMSAFRKKTALIKVPFVIEHIQGILDKDPANKVFVGAHHKEVMDKIQEHFQKQGIQVARVDGGTNPKRVMAEANAFNQDANCRVFLNSILCATGLNLQEKCHHAVLAELDWVPGNLTQWEGRIWRIGQYFPCEYDYLVIDKSLDSYLCPKLVKKLETLEKALDDERGNERTARASVHHATATANPRLTKVSNPPSQGAQTAPGGAQHTTQAPKTPYRAAQGPPQGGFGTGSTAQNGSTPPASASTPPSPAPKAPSSDPIAPRAHRALQALAAVCNSARTVDGTGFSKHDTDFGKSLAARPFITDRMLPYALALVVKYRRQVNDTLLVQDATAWLNRNPGRVRP